jgi:hypothetical protein
MGYLGATFILDHACQESAVNGCFFNLKELLLAVDLRMRMATIFSEFIFPRACRHPIKNQAC